MSFEDQINTSSTPDTILAITLASGAVVYARLSALVSFHPSPAGGVSIHLTNGEFLETVPTVTIDTLLTTLAGIVSAQVPVLC